MTAPHAPALPLTSDASRAVARRSNRDVLALVAERDALRRANAHLRAELAQAAILIHPEPDHA